MTQRIALVFLTAAAWLATVPAGRADMVNIAGDTVNSTSHVGNFTGSLTYTDINATHATLTIQLTNTTPWTYGGYLTGFAFNNPGNLITNVTSVSFSDASFSLLGAPGYSNDINGMPYGSFDVGAALGGNLLGGGSPNAGLAAPVSNSTQGQSGTFTFNLFGSNGGLDTLTAMSFVNTLSVDPSTGYGSEFMVVRFKGLNIGGDGSDKVPGVLVTPNPDPAPPPPIVPEPATLLLGCFGALALCPAGWRRLRPQII